MGIMQRRIHTCAGTMANLYKPLVFVWIFLAFSFCERSNDGSQYPSTNSSDPAPNEMTCVCGWFECAVCAGDGVCCTPGSWTSLCCHVEYPQCCPPLILGSQCCEADALCCPTPLLGEHGCCEKTEPVCCPGGCCKLGEICCPSGDEGCCGPDEPLCCPGGCCEKDKVCCDQDKNTVACCDSADKCCGDHC